MNRAFSKRFPTDSEVSGASTSRGRSTPTFRLAERLRSLPEQEDLAGSWTEFKDVIHSIHQADNQRVTATEAELEHQGDPLWNGQPLGRLLALQSERLLGEMDEAWCRLTARTLVEGLKKPEQSLRDLAGKVSVSAAYLSQMSHGRGPTPSDRTLDRLHAAFGEARASVPETPRPTEAFHALHRRADDARRRLRSPGAAAHPTITVAYPWSEQLERELAQAFETIADRAVDDEEGDAMRRLLEFLSSAEATVLDDLATLAHDSQAQEVLHAVAQMTDPAREHLVSLLLSMQRPQNATEPPTTKPRSQKGPIP